MQPAQGSPPATGRPSSFVELCRKALSRHPVVLDPVDADASLARLAEEPEHPYQGKVDFQGIEIHLENKRGSMRRGHGWATRMRHHYGEIRDTRGTDGDPIDVYVGPNHDAHRVVVVHQKEPGTKTHDEDKVMLGFDSVSEALREYRAHYDKPGFYMEHTVMSVPEFQRWLKRRGADGQKICKGFLHLADLLKARKPAPGQLALFGPTTTPATTRPAPEKKPAEPKPAAAPTTAKVAIVESKTKKGKPTWVAQEPGRLDRDAWMKRRDQARGAGGWWDSKKRGWAFRSADKAQAFASSTMVAPATTTAAKPKAPTAAQRRAEIHAGKRPDGAGWAPIPKGKRGGFRRRKKTGKGWEHWYPQHPKWTAHQRPEHDKPTKWTLAGGNLQITDSGARGDERFVVSQKLPRFVGTRESGVEWSEASTHATLKEARAAADKAGARHKQTVEGARRVAAKEEEARKKRMAPKPEPKQKPKAEQRKADKALADEAHSAASKYASWIKEEQGGLSPMGREASRISNLRDVAIRLNSGRGGEGDRKEARRAIDELKEKMVPAAKPEPKPSGPEPLVTAQLDDIPRQTAEGAYRHTSHTPGRRGEQVRAEYVEHIKSVEQRLAKRAKTPEQREELREELQRYKATYRSKLLAVLEAKSRTASPMITGPSKFPTARNRKRMETADRRTSELLDWSAKAVARIGNKIDPPSISSDRGDEAVSALKKKIEDAEKLQDTMKRSNRVIRSKKLSDEQKMAKLGEIGVGEKSAKLLLKPDRWGKVVGFESYQLTNNNANIRRMKERVAGLERELATPGGEHKFDGGTVVDNPDDNRIEIHYDGKPDAETISKLKSGGFRWSRAKGAWQRHRSNASRYAVERMTGVKVPGPATKGFIALSDLVKAHIHEPKPRGAVGGSAPSPRPAGGPPGAGRGFLALADLLKAVKPPGGGWGPIPGGKHGGFRRPKAGGWEHWYPEAGHAKSAAKHHEREAKAARKKIRRRLGKLSTEELVEALDAHEDHAAAAHQAKTSAARIKATKQAAKVQAKIAKQLKRAGASDEEIESVLRAHAQHSGQAGREEAPKEEPAAPAEEPTAEPKTFPELVQQALSHPKVLAAIQDAVREAQGEKPKAAPERPAEKPKAEERPEVRPKPSPGPAEKPPEKKDVDVRPKRAVKPQIITREMDAHRNYLERQLAALKEPGATPNAQLQQRLEADIDRLKRGDGGPIKEHTERVKALTDMMAKMAGTTSPEEAAKLAPKLQAAADEHRAKHTVPGVKGPAEALGEGAAAAAGDEAERQRAAKRHGVKPEELIFTGGRGYVPRTGASVAQRKLGLEEPGRGKAIEPVTRKEGETAKQHEARRKQRRKEGEELQRQSRQRAWLTREGTAPTEAQRKDRQAMSERFRSDMAETRFDTKKHAVETARKMLGGRLEELAGQDGVQRFVHDMIEKRGGQWRTRRPETAKSLSFTGLASLLKVHGGAA
jgi:hypothetical protein